MRGYLFAMMTLAVLLQSDALAQMQPRVSQPQYESVEQMHEDVSPLAISLRSFQRDLRKPTGFQTVFRLPLTEQGIDGQQMGEKFMRIDGALAAVFPQSLYVNTREGIIPVVPAGTIYHIGLPETAPPPRPQPSRPELLVTAESAAMRSTATEAIKGASLAEERDVGRSTRSAVLTGLRPVGASDDETADSGLGEDRLRTLLRRAVEAEQSNARAE